MSFPLRERDYEIDVDSIDPQKLWRELHERTYLHGLCYSFAIAMARGLGWPLFGFLSYFDDKFHVFKTPWHVMVRSPEGVFYDVRGTVPHHLLDEPYAQERTIFEIQEFTEAELHKRHPTSEISIESAARIAHILFPDLPWKVETFPSRVQAFARELEVLSRKYGCWIRASIPAQPPMISPGDESEGGYVLTPVLGEFSIDRYF